MKKNIKRFFIGLAAFAMLLSSGCGGQENDIALTDGNLTQKPQTSADGQTSSGSDTIPPAPQSIIDLQDAIGAALKHAGLSEDEVTILKARLDDENGVSEYELEFTYASNKYEYEINAVSGSIVKFSAEAAETAETETQISEEQAKSIALEHSGVTEEQAVFVKLKSENSGGVLIYEIEFTANSARYKYEIEANGGSIIEFSAETLPSAEAQTSAAETQASAAETGSAVYITEEEAKKAALDHAGLSESQVTFIKVKYDADDGSPEYDIEFTANSVKYEYEIKASGGTVLKYSSEPIYTGSASATGSASEITLEEAKAAALQYAKVSASDAEFVKTKRDHDDGMVKYDIEFIAGGVKYEIEIKAADGTVLEFSSEQIFDDRQNSYVGGLISEEEAKKIALKHTGFSADQVSFTKIELDKDDGINEYKVEFYVNGIEYEVKINAANGAVLETEIDE